MLVTLTSNTVSGQTKPITGKVFDNEGETLIGASVFIKGSAGVGTITDKNGAYSLSLKNLQNVTLVYSYIGLKTQEIKVGKQTSINVTLASDAEMLKDVVVVGFGTQNKKTVVGSITQTTGAEILKAGNVSTISEALTGLLPGVSTMQAAGQPGATAANILIRGQASWVNSNPLFVVDGVERDFNDLDPNEVESISVLKDASATAVYGVKAANGVVLITTKRGIKGAPKVSFTGNWTHKSPAVETDYFDTYDKSLEYYNVAAKNDGLYSLLRPQSEIDMWRNPNRDTNFYTYTNWVNTMIGTGKSSAYNVNVTGGKDFVTYFTSFGYNYDGDIFNLKKQKEFDPRTSQSRYNWRSNLDFKFTKTTKVKVNLSGDFKNWSGNRVTYSARNGIGSIGTGGDEQYLARLYQQVQVGAPPVLSNGELGVGNAASDWFKMNYVGEMEREGQNMERSTRIFSDMVFEQRFLKDFLFKASASYNFSRAYGSSITANPIYYLSDPATQKYVQFGTDQDLVNSLVTFNGEGLGGFSSSLYYEGSLLYEKKIKGHAFSGLALVSRRTARSGASFPSFEESWVGRATYAYKSKYLAEINAAYNGSEKFAPGLRFGFFPSLATGWVLSEESIFKNNVNFINFMKVRYSWGKIGSDLGASRFTYISSYNPGPVGYVAGENGYPGGYGNTLTAMGNNGILYLEGKPANANATWETSTKQNLGIEMTFLGGKLRSTIDFFDEKRTGILMTRRTIPGLYGNVFPDANIGKTKNHGIDFELKYNGKINKDWDYYLSGNFSISENRIVDRDDPIYTPEYQKQAGKPIGWSSGYIDNGLLGSWDDAYNNTQTIVTNLIPGDFSFMDYNADGKIDQLDRAPIGNPSYATKSFAFNLGVTYKQFSLSAMFNGMMDISKELSSAYLWEFSSTGGINFAMTDTEMKNYWTPDNLTATHPALHTLDNKYNSSASTYTFRRSDFLRLRNLELKYSVNSKDAKWLQVVKNLEIYLNGNNLITWSSLPKQFDPEANKLEVYPITKRYNLGMRFSL
jgi:TonB-linked SusC/RagA family outer membrane protein